MPEVLARRRNDTPAPSLSSASDYSPSTDDTSTRATPSRPRSQLLSNFNQAMAWLSRTPTTPIRPDSPTQSTSSGRSPKSPRTKPRTAVSTTPTSPSPRLKAPPLSTSPATKASRDEPRKPTVRSKDYEQALMDPEAYTLGRAKIVNLRPVIDGASTSSSRKGAPTPPALQIRSSSKVVAPRRSSLKKGSHDVPPSPSFPPSTIAPFNRLVVEQSALPPFDPQLLAGPPPPGTYSRNTLVTLETSSMTMRTTIDTLISRPSLLAQHILSLCPDPPSGPPKVPSENMHIFLDRPSPPYHIILSYLRLPRSTDNALPALPRAVQLPAHSQTTSMVGVSKLEALLDLRDEARWLGLEELEAMCEAELRNAGLVKAPKPLAIAEDVELRRSSESDMPPTTASSMASASPSLSSLPEVEEPVVSSARSIPTPPSSDSDARQFRARVPSSPMATMATVSPLSPRSRTAQRRQPTGSHLDNRPLPAIPSSAEQSDHRCAIPSSSPVPTIIAPAPNPLPTPSHIHTSSTSSIGLTEDEKARRAREKLSEALSLRRRHGGSLQEPPVMTTPTRESFASARSLNSSPGRYL